MNNFFGLQPINQYLFLHPEEELRVREWEASLKRHALIFDKIGIYGYREEGEPDSINWLIEQDVLFRVAFEPSKEFVIAAYPEIEVYLPELFKWYSEEQKEETSYQNRAAKAHENLEKLDRDLTDLGELGKNLEDVSNKLRHSEDIDETIIREQLSETEKKIEEIKERMKEKSIEIKLVISKEDQQLEKLSSLLLRIMAKQVEFLNKATVVPLLPLSEYLTDIPAGIKSDVVEVVIKKLPIPGPMTPWEAIIDYRKDDDTQRSLRALRSWIRKISSQDLPAKEVEEELESLIDEFESHMKLHKLKADTELLQTLIKAPLELIENLLRAKPSKLIDPLFALRKRQISLMEAEINAPGKEIAFVIRTKETFYESD